MMTKLNNYINKFFCKLPIEFHLAVIVIVSLGTGTVRTVMNNREAKVADGITWSIIEGLIVIYTTYLILDFVEKYSGKITVNFKNKEVLVK